MDDSPVTTESLGSDDSQVAVKGRVKRNRLKFGGDSDKSQRARKLSCMRKRTYTRDTTRQSLLSQFMTENSDTRGTPPRDTQVMDHCLGKKSLDVDQRSRGWSG